MLVPWWRASSDMRSTSSFGMFAVTFEKSALLRAIPASPGCGLPVPDARDHTEYGADTVQIRLCGVRCGRSPGGHYGLMIEVEATHITVGDTYPRLVCELYPGVFLVDGYRGCYSVLRFADRVEPLEHKEDRVFPVSERSAEDAAEMYEKLVQTYAERRELAKRIDPTVVEALVWPPAWWSSRTRADRESR